MNWQGSALGNFGNAVLNALETKREFGVNAAGQIRATMLRFIFYRRPLMPDEDDPASMEIVSIHDRLTQRTVFLPTRSEI